MTSRVRAPIPALLLAVPLLVLLDTGFVRADCQADCVLVNTASDTINPTCNTSGIGTCSLRDALIIVQGFEGWSIRFAIGTGHQTINLMSNLPDIIKSGTIDGRTQPGFAGVPLIEIHRADTGSAWRGLHLGQPPFLTSAGVAMKALVINHFNTVCADCGGIIMDNPGGNYIQGCYIGTDAAGMAADKAESFCGHDSLHELTSFKETTDVGALKFDSWVAGAPAGPAGGLDASCRTGGKA